jgi:hypothetical protein
VDRKQTTAVTMGMVLAIALKIKKHVQSSHTIFGFPIQLFCTMIEARGGLGK